jgi:hypothetical protein
MFVDQESLKVEVSIAQKNVTGKADPNGFEEIMFLGGKEGSLSSPIAIFSIIL